MTLISDTAKTNIVLVVGPTASGKSKEAIRIALERGGEVISVDSRQVYRGLDIGTEKITHEEMQGVPHHLIDIRDVQDVYTASDFCADAKRLIAKITEQGKVPILAGGSHFYVDALLYGLPGGVGLPGEKPDADLRAQLEPLPIEELIAEVKEKDPTRFAQLDPANKRRLVRAVELIRTYGKVPERSKAETQYEVEWVVINPDRELLRERIDARLKEALERGLIDEVRHVRTQIDDERLNELGLEYRVVGEYLRGERKEESLLPALSSRLWHYARRQKAWLRKLATESSATIDS
jgi:tRNA dimethylallyltransferase